MRVGVAACVCVAVVLGVVYLVRAVDELGEQASVNAAANYDDREFAGGNSLVADKRALYEARALIPPEGSLPRRAGAERRRRDGADGAVHRSVRAFVPDAATSVRRRRMDPLLRL